MSLEQLQRFCSDDEGRPSIQTPYLCEVGGEAWSIGTDGRRMLALRGRLVEPRSDAPDAAHILTKLDTAKNLGAVDISELAAFVGVPPEKRICTECKNGRVKCDECDGDGEEECECECGHEHSKVCSVCRGSGDFPCPTCKGWRESVRIDCQVVIGDSVFDRAIVATCLADAERMTGSATLMQGGETGISALIGDGWRLVFMPLRDDPAYPRDRMPKFPLPAEAAS